MRGISVLAIAFIFILLIAGCVQQTPTPTPTLIPTSTPTPTPMPTPTPTPAVQFTCWDNEVVLDGVTYKLPVSVDFRGKAIYHVVALWTTLNGSWDSVPACARQWQRDTLGGDHHIYMRVETRAGDPVATTYVVDWPPYDDSVAAVRQAEPDGWANVPIAGQNWNPLAGPGPYLAWVFNGDRVYGMGLPYNRHVSYFIVWRAD